MSAWHFSKIKHVPYMVHYPKSFEKFCLLKILGNTLGSSLQYRKNINVVITTLLYSSITKYYYFIVVRQDTSIQN